MAQESSFRTETDSFGPIEVPADRYWGAQTQRSLQNFRIGADRMPLPVIHALGIVKKVAATLNAGYGRLDERLADAIRQAADEVIEGLAGELAAELDTLEAGWPRDLPSGVIHADLFPDNVFFRSGRLSGLIDFYFACNDFLAYDLAICLNAWCFEADGQFNVTKAKRLLTGYSKVRKLSPGELDSLPILARGGALRFLLTRLFDWLNTPPGAMVVRKDPLEYLDKLRFHRAVAGPAAYGLG